jgi:hypothetical protein
VKRSGIELVDPSRQLTVLVVEITKRNRPDRAGLSAPGWLAIFQQVDAKGAFLGDFLLFVPPNPAVGAGVCDVTLTPALHGIDQDNPIVPLHHGIVREASTHGALRQCMHGSGR